MWELDNKESWALKNWWFWIVLKTVESPLDCKEIQPVNAKGNQSWIFTGRTDAEAETPILWPPDEKNWLIGKSPDAGKDWRWEEKGMTEDEMVGWHHWLNGHEFEQAPVVGDGQGSLARCSPWVTKSQTWLSDWTKLVTGCRLHFCLKEGWTWKNWRFQIVVLKKTLESFLDSKEFRPVNSRGNQLWIFIRKTNAEAPILWQPDAKSPLIGKDPDAGKDWRQTEKGATENEMVM